MNVLITTLISAQDPKQPLLVHVLPSVRCWEHWASGTRNRDGCCSHALEWKWEQQWLWPHLSTMPRRLPVQKTWGLRHKPSGRRGVNAEEGSRGSCSLKLKETGTETRSLFCNRSLDDKRRGSSTFVTIIRLLLKLSACLPWAQHRRRCTMLGDGRRWSQCYDLHLHSGGSQGTLSGSQAGWR